MEVKHNNPELMEGLVKIIDRNHGISQKERLLVDAAFKHIEALEAQVVKSESDLVAFKSVVMLIQNKCHHLVKEPYFDDITKMSGDICENCMKVFQKSVFT